MPVCVAALAALTARATEAQRLQISIDGFGRRRGERLFPAYFEQALHPLMASLLPLDAEKQAAVLNDAFPELMRAVLRSAPWLSSLLHQ